jgi:hypothetical protein
LYKWQNLGFDFAHQQRIRRLQGSDGRNARGPLHLFHIEVRYPNPADLALLLQTRHLRPALFNIGFRFGPVDLVEIDHVEFQAP